MNKKIEQMANITLTVSIIIFLAVIALGLHTINAKAIEGINTLPSKETPQNATWSNIVKEVDYSYLMATIPTTTEIAEPEYEYIGEFTVTAYCPCVKCCGIWSAEHPKRKGTDYVQKTASGTIPEAGRTVGANTSILPFGTVILINEHEYTVEDTGGAAKNKKIIDIYFDTHEEAVEFGKQKLKVYVLED